MQAHLCCKRILEAGCYTDNTGRYKKPKLSNPVSTNKEYLIRTRCSTLNEDTEHLKHLLVKEVGRRNEINLQCYQN